MAFFEIIPYVDCADRGPLKASNRTHGGQNLTRARCKPVSCRLEYLRQFDKKRTGLSTRKPVNFLRSSICSTHFGTPERFDVGKLGSNSPLCGPWPCPQLHLDIDSLNTHATDLICIVFDIKVSWLSSTADQRYSNEGHISESVCNPIEGK